MATHLLRATAVTILCFAEKETTMIWAEFLLLIVVTFAMGALGLFIGCGAVALLRRASARLASWRSRRHWQRCQVRLFFWLRGKGCSLSAAWRLSGLRR
jgi:hypothetical protein